ncbi:hypothetical protein [Salipiger mangrovisoli]|uniref:Uncharacterized protein n=1 Tax=Salipiger mangrovisoli TaxID=2865933 RepID=A0ABR9X5M5_9RHOB|nr:hypothetical protein [Salipiger mangrovisoli]MBE9638843.1 hypothetical protein [Salipiger mangrovisoli]
MQNQQMGAMEMSDLTPEKLDAALRDAGITLPPQELRAAFDGARKMLQLASQTKERAGD